MARNFKPTYEDTEVIVTLEDARQLAIRAQAKGELHRKIHKAQLYVKDLLELRDRVARMNPHIGEIGEGMLFQLVEEARRLGGAA